MISTEQRFEVPRSPSAVFRFVATDFFENQPKWALTTLTRDGTGAVAVGSGGKEIRKVPIGKAVSKVKVTEYDAPERFSYTTDSRVAFGTVSYRLEKTSGGTKVTHRVELRPQGIGRLLSFLMSGSLDVAAKADMGRLRELLAKLPPGGSVGAL